MSEVSASHYCRPPAFVLPPSVQGSGNGANLVDDFFALAERFGADGVITASEARFLKHMGDMLKDQIAGSDLSRSVKDRLSGAIDAQVTDAEAAVPRDIDEAMSGSSCEKGIETYCTLIREGLELANEQGSTGREALEFAQDYARDVMEGSHGHHDASETHGASSGGAEPASRSDAVELGRERAAEAANEGGSAGGGGGVGGGISEDDVLDSLIENGQRMADESREDENGGKKGGLGGGGGNWLIALAKGLAMIQDKFLTEALNNLKIMENTAGYGDTGETGGAQQQQMKSEFLIASSKYQAATQMFSMMANMTATSLKTIGEGLTAIARKQ